MGTRSIIQLAGTCRELFPKACELLHDSLAKEDFSREQERFGAWCDDQKVSGKGLDAIDRRFQLSDLEKQSTLRNLDALKEAISEAINLLQMNPEARSPKWESLEDDENSLLSEESDSSQEDSIHTQLWDILEAVRIYNNMLIKFSFEGPDGPYHSSLDEPSSELAKNTVRAYWRELAMKNSTYKTTATSINPEISLRLEKSFDLRLALISTITSSTHESFSGQGRPLSPYARVEITADVFHRLVSDSNSVTTLTPARRPDKSCPLCFEDLKGENYQQHILRHLRPYSCTYEVCPSAHVNFATREQWIDHESQSHRSTWLCPDCPLSDEERFSHCEDFKNHLRKFHSDFYDERDLKVAAKYSWSGEEDNRSSCFLCSAQNLTQRLETHMMEHFEFLSLLALHDINLGPKAENNASIVAEQNAVLEDTFTTRPASFYSWGTVFLLIDAKENPGIDPRANCDIIPGNSVTNGDFHHLIKSATPLRPPWWFIVIAEDRNACFCLRIRTYEGTGVAALPENVFKEDHSIVYENGQSDKPDPSEISYDSETDRIAMSRPIEVVKTTRDTTLKLHRLARLFWKKVYKVSHDNYTAPFGIIQAPSAAGTLESVFEEKNPDSHLHVRRPVGNSSGSDYSEYSTPTVFSKATGKGSASSVWSNSSDKADSAYASSIATEPTEVSMRTSRGQFGRFSRGVARGKPIYRENSPLSESPPPRSRK